jgi:hypothetical protein
MLVNLFLDRLLLLLSRILLGLCRDRLFLCGLLSAIIYKRLLSLLLLDIL